MRCRGVFIICAVGRGFGERKALSNSRLCRELQSLAIVEEEVPLEIVDTSNNEVCRGVDIEDSKNLKFQGLCFILLLIGT